jgi:hypothetical protein
MASKSFRQRAAELANAIFRFGKPAPGPVLTRQPASRVTVSMEDGSERAMNLGVPSDLPTAGDPPEPGRNFPLPMSERVTSERVQQYIFSRINPIRGLTPSRLSSALEQWDIGFLRDAGIIWDKIKQRDDQIQSVAIKRELKPTDMPWEIVTTDESDAAMQHKKALEDFYNSITVTHCTEGNTRGSVQLLIKQMMRAVGDKYSVHEIIWKPEMGALSAEFRFVPVWFFEARTGVLRFLPYELAFTGVDLEPAGWVVHTGDGLFQASSIAYLYKQLALKTWVNYNEKFGMPFLHGSSAAAPGSEEWDNFRSALLGFSSDGAILTTIGSTIEAVNAGAGTGSTIPMESLLERMDRAIGRVWNGGDLHSMSRGGGQGLGSNPQMESQDDLAKTDAERLGETLNQYVDAWVIKYRFGVDKPLAKFILQPAKDQNIDQDLAIDEFLISALPDGTLGVQDFLERYGRAKVDAGEEAIMKPAAPIAVNPQEDVAGEVASGKEPFANISTAGRKQFNVTGARIVADQMALALAPLRARIEQAQKIQDPAVRKINLQKIVEDLPRYLKQHAKDPGLITAISDTLSTALVAGASEGARANGNGHVNGVKPSLIGGRT